MRIPMPQDPKPQSPACTLNPKPAQDAAERHIQFQVALYADPLYRGDYPAAVRDRVPGLPTFTAAERAALLGSLDYYAMNHYASKCALG